MCIKDIYKNILNIINLFLNNNKKNINRDLILYKIIKIFFFKLKTIN